MLDKIPQSIKELHKMFASEGKKLYLVGGCVRDSHTGDTPKDFDLATDALPDEVLSIVEGKYRTNLQGKAFGVVVVYTKDQPEGIEIATFREDVSRGRNPEVRLGATIEEDVKRRDITYNAMFFDLDNNSVVDLVGGREDLDRGMTRMVGDPIERFEEDSLRILRAFRFASRYGHQLHTDTESAIGRRNQLQNIDPENGTMKRISQERIWEEIKKAWGQAREFKSYLGFYSKFDMWKEVFPGTDVCHDYLGTKDFTVEVAGLFRNENTKGLEKRLVQDFKIEIETAKKVVFLIDLSRMKIEEAFDMAKRRQQCGISEETLVEWLETTECKNAISKKFTGFKFSVSSKELMDQGLSGKELGIRIRQLENDTFRRMVNS